MSNPHASTYSDESYIQRCVAVYRNGGNWQGMIAMLNHADTMRFHQLVAKVDVGQAVRAIKVSDTTAHEILARQLGER